MIAPELLLRTTVVEDYSENSIQASIDDLIEHLKSFPGVIWNAYSQKYGVMIKEFPYEARNGFFIDLNTRTCTHRFISKGIMRRDKLFEEDIYKQLVPKIYRPNWFDTNDAIRSYAIIITNIEKLEEEVSVSNFGLFNSWGKVSNGDEFHHPRLIKASWKENL